MKSPRSSRSITLVLLTSASFLAACEDNAGTVQTYVPAENPTALQVERDNALLPEFDATQAATQPATTRAAPRSGMPGVTAVRPAQPANRTSSPPVSSSVRSSTITHSSSSSSPFHIG